MRQDNIVGRLWRVYFEDSVAQIRVFRSRSTISSFRSCRQLRNWIQSWSNLTVYLFHRKNYCKTSSSHLIFVVFKLKKCLPKFKRHFFDLRVIRKLSLRGMMDEAAVIATIELITLSVFSEVVKFTSLILCFPISAASIKRLLYSLFHNTFIILVIRSFIGVQSLIVSKCVSLFIW